MWYGAYVLFTLKYMYYNNIPTHHAYTYCVYRWIKCIYEEMNL